LAGEENEVEIKCLRDSDVLLCCGTVANEQDEKLFWNTLGAESKSKAMEQIATQTAVATTAFKQTPTGEETSTNTTTTTTAITTTATAAATSTDDGVSYPILYLRSPSSSSYEILSTYDDDDLDPASVLVLRASANLIYVCVGADCSNDAPISNQNDDAVALYMKNEYQKGLFGTVLSSVKNQIQIIVVREGISVEWNDFMDAFVEGL